MRRTENGDLRLFREKSEEERMHTREAAFGLHAERVQNSEGLLFGDAHFSFPRARLGELQNDHPEAEYGLQPVMPRAAWKVYSAIVYLDTSPSVVQERLANAATIDSRNEWATALTVLDIQRWIQYEKRKLRLECDRRNIAFIAISGEDLPANLATEVMKRIHDATTMMF
jgi:hypothetical protein